MDEGKVIDFDLAVVATISSSHLSQMRRPLTMLNLSLHYADGSNKDGIFELSERDIDILLTKCAAINSTLENWADAH